MNKNLGRLSIPYSFCLFGVFLWFIYVFLFILPGKSFAAFSFSILEVTPTEIDSKDQELRVRIRVNSLPAGDSFFRASVKNGNSYIGYIRNNNGDWIKMGSLDSDRQNSKCSDYYKISADGEYILVIKIGFDNEIDNGEYIIKAHRFTSTCGSYSSSNEEIDFKINVLLPTPTPTSTPTSTPTPVSTTSPSSSKPKATVKINSAKDQNNSELIGSLKIYIDGNYTGNYAPETYTFCDDCKCGSNNVSCSFGNHTFKVEKTGYNSWIKTSEINADNNYEFDPVLILASSTSSPTTKPTPTLITTASATPKSTVANIVFSTESALLAGNNFAQREVLGAETSQKQTETPAPTPSDSKFKFAALFFIISGLSFLGSAVYAYLKKKKNAKPDESKSEEAG